MKKFILIVGLFCTYTAFGMEYPNLKKSELITMRTIPIFERLVIYPLGQFKKSWERKYNIPDYITNNKLTTPQEIVAAAGYNFLNKDHSLIWEAISDDNRQENPYSYYLACGYTKIKKLDGQYDAQLTSLKQQQHWTTVKKRVWAGLGIGCTAGLAYLLFQQNKSGSFAELLDLKNNCTRIASALATAIPLCGFGYWKNNKHLNALRPSISEITKKVSLLQATSQFKIETIDDLSKYIEDNMTPEVYKKLFQTTTFDYEKAIQQVQDTDQCHSKIEYQMGFGGYIKGLMITSLEKGQAPFTVHRKGYHPTPITVERAEDSSSITFIGFPDDDKLRWERIFEIDNRIKLDQVQKKASELLDTIEKRSIPVFDPCNKGQVISIFTDFLLNKVPLTQDEEEPKPCFLYLEDSDDQPILMKVQNRNGTYTLSTVNDDADYVPVVKYRWDGSIPDDKNIGRFSARIIDYITDGNESADKKDSMSDLPIFTYENIKERSPEFTGYVKLALQHAKIDYHTPFSVKDGDLLIRVILQKLNDDQMRIIVKRRSFDISFSSNRTLEDNIQDICIEVCSLLNSETGRTPTVK